MPQFDLGPFTATDRVKMEVQPPEGYEDSEICDRCELEKADGVKLITYVNDETLLVYLVCGHCGHIRQISEGPILVAADSNSQIC